jgi:hypothetical protein
MPSFLGMLAKSKGTHDHLLTNRVHSGYSKCTNTAYPKFIQGNTADIVLVGPLFQDGRIDKLAGLQDMAISRSIHLVGLDVEGQDGVSNGVNRISVAARAAPDTGILSGGTQHAEVPVDLSDMMERHGVEAHLVNRLDAIMGWDHASGQAGEMILVTWDCQSELYTRPPAYPDLLTASLAGSISATLYPEAWPETLRLWRRLICGLS